MATEIESLLDYVVSVGGSELIVTEGAPPLSALRAVCVPCPMLPLLSSVH